MQGIIYVLDLKKGPAARLFQVRLEERSQNAVGKWQAAGPRRVYTADQLEALALRALDRDSLKTALQSELTLRRREGRFFSPNDPVSVLRLSPEALPGFLKAAVRHKILVQSDGEPLSYRHDGKPDLTLTLTPSEKGARVELLLEDRPFHNVDFIFDAAPLIVLEGNRLTAMPTKFTRAFLDSLPLGRALPEREIAPFLERLEQWGAGIRLPALDKKTVEDCPVYPWVMFHPHLHYANLEFEYPENLRVAHRDASPEVRSPEGRTVYRRNTREENAYAALLEKSGAMPKSSAHGAWYFPSETFQRAAKMLEGEGFQLSCEGRSLRLPDKPRWQVFIREERLELQGSLPFGGRELPLSRLLTPSGEVPSLLALDHETVGVIPQDVRETIQALLEEGEPQGDGLAFAKGDAAFLDAVLGSQENLFGEDSLKALAHLEPGALMGERHLVPATFQGTLRPYQHAGFEWLVHLARHNLCGLLADDMGLGKTIQVLALLDALRGSTGGPSLVVVPASLVFNWLAEGQRFVPHHRVLAHTGAGRSRERGTFDDLDWVVTTYATLRLDAELLASIKWHLLVLDESHTIKNPEARISQAVKTIPCRHRVSLTGTPLENRLKDLWSQFDFLMPGFLRDERDFQQRYRAEDPDSLKRLRLKLKPLILRRTKENVLPELPPKTEVTLICEMSRDQEQFYEAARAAAQSEWRTAHGQENQPGRRRLHLLELILRLRQICCHPRLITAAGEAPAASGKLNQILEMAGEILAEGHKILCFSQFTRFLKLLRTEVESIPARTFYLDGQTVNRQEVITGFQSCTEPAVFLISLKAGGVGLNLTEADYVFIMDPWWNPAVERQAVDRAHRIGQTRPVTVYRFLTRQTIEEKVEKLQAAKRGLESQVLDGAGPAPFTDGELEALLD